MAECARGKAQAPPGTTGRRQGRRGEKKARQTNRRGRGLVKTSSDFGHAGTPPTHPKLLDWLAAEFIENGWSVKKLHKTILLSQTYQRSSRADDATANRVDPGNDLFWRQNLRRLEAE